jgi:hypothetical protein
MFSQRRRRHNLHLRSSCYFWAKIKQADQQLEEEVETGAAA